MVWVLFHIQFIMSASLGQIFSRAVFLAAVTTKSPSKRIRHMKKQAQVIKPSWLGMDHFFFFFFLLTDWCVYDSMVRPDSPRSGDLSLLLVVLEQQGAPFKKTKFTAYWQGSCSAALAPIRVLRQQELRLHCLSSGASSSCPGQSPHTSREMLCLCPTLVCSPAVTPMLEAHREDARCCHLQGHHPTPGVVSPSAGHLSGRCSLVLHLLKMGHPQNTPQGQAKRVTLLPLQIASWFACMVL